MIGLDRHEGVLVLIPVGLLGLGAWSLTTPSRDLVVLTVGAVLLAILVAEVLFRRPPS